MSDLLRERYSFVDLLIFPVFLETHISDWDSVYSRVNQFEILVTGVISSVSGFSLCEMTHSEVSHDSFIHVT